MRWESQKVGGDQSQLELPGMPGLVRSVRTPEFAGMVFHEVIARSVLNKVPGRSPLPFGWTVNPYRGCGHACTYCMVGDTPILLADGRTMPLAGLKVGDQVYGTTVGDDGTRRYTATTVLDHWATTRPAYRVTLDDGTQLVTSGDHRLLTDVGWRYVARDATGGRPYLAAGDALVGTGQFAVAPKESADYRLGYLCGVIRGDGRLCPYTHPGTAGGRLETGRLRLAVVEYEALVRTRGYLAAAGIATDRFLFDTRPDGRRREILTVRTAGRREVELVGQLVRWPVMPSDEWRKGFLAGVFDVEGAVDDVIGISNTDPEVISHVVTAARRFGFDAVVGDAGPPTTGGGVPVDARPTPCVLLRGSLAERLRFFHTVDPAITRKRDLRDAVVGDGPLPRVRSVEPLGMELTLYDMSTGTGDFIADGVVSHNCFARHTHTYLDLDAGADFDRQVVVKVNAPEVLSRELNRPAWTREPVAMGTNTDPYQRAEGRYRLMPGIIAALAAARTPFSVLTKGTLLARDLPLLAEAARRVTVGIGVSIAMLDKRLSASVEPGTPSPQARLDLVRRVREAGLPCGVMVAPVLPGLSDGTEQLDGLLGEVADAGATSATVLALHLRPGAREWYRGWLAREHPELVPRYDALYAHGANADRGYRAWLARRVGPLLRRHGLHRPQGQVRPAAAAAGAAGPAAVTPAGPPAAGPTLFDSHPVP
ncbi:MAG TPA: intein-containing Rv2578c family radical SAM protein [Pseudonocardiaceae bacterium]